MNPFYNYPDPDVKIAFIPNFTAIPFLVPLIVIAILTLSAMAVFLYIHYASLKIKPNHIAIIKRLDQILISTSPVIYSIPWIDEVTMLPLAPIDFFLEVKGVQNTEGLQFNILATVKAALDDSSSALHKAVIYFKKELDLFSVATELFKSTVSIAFLNCDSRLNTLLFSTEEIRETTENLLREELFSRGLILISLSFREIEDSGGIMKNFKEALAKSREEIHKHQQ